jgi:hypothetical protein
MKKELTPRQLRRNRRAAKAASLATKSKGLKYDVPIKPSSGRYKIGM